MKVLGKILVVVFVVAVLFFGTSLVMSNIHKKTLVDEWKSWTSNNQVEKVIDTGMRGDADNDSLDDIVVLDKELDVSNDSNIDYEVYPL